MSDLLNIGASGVRAYQSALTTVSDNIANAGTAGYSRKTTTLQQVVATDNVASIGASANGVAATAIVSTADGVRAAEVRASGADLAKSETSVTTLTSIQSALTGSALGDRLTDFFNSATAVAADPSASAPRSTMLEAASSVASAFAATGKALDASAADLDSTAQNGVATLNSLGAALAKVNDGLGRTAAGTSGAASLMDQRDQILEQMSAISDVSVTTDAAGRATVKLGGATGATFVSGTSAGAVTYTRSDSGDVSFSVHYAGTISTLTPNGGALAGVADSAQQIASARSQLDAIATSFTQGVNAVQAQGEDLNGNAGAAMFATGATATDITVSLTDPSGLAAAAVGGGTRDNSNLTALTNLRSSGAFESDTTKLISGNAATLASRQKVVDAQTAIHDSAVAARDSTSGVSLDNEAVDLMRFQQAYSASSRVIQTARDIFQSILDIR